MQYSVFSSLTAFSDRLFYVLLVLVLALIANRLIQRLINRFAYLAESADRAVIAAQKARLRTLRGLMRNIASLSVWGTALLISLSELGVDIAPLIAGAGVLGFAIGFGSQQLVKDFLGGFFVLLENQFNRGDLVEVAGKKGEVVQINLRTTILRGADGTTYIIPNSQLGVVARIK